MRNRTTKLIWLDKVKKMEKLSKKDVREKLFEFKENPIRAKE